MTGILLIDLLFTLCLTFATVWLLSRLWRLGKPECSFTEAALFGLTGFPVLINLLVSAASLLPYERPLDDLWLWNLTVLGGLGFLVWRKARVGGAPRSSFVAEAAAGVRAAVLDRGRISLARLACVLAVVLFLIGHFVVGLLNAPLAWDVLSYHTPMAVQPYQDGVLKKLESPLPWAEWYPRGVETVWYWTLYWTHTDVLFHFVQWLFGIQALTSALYIAMKLRQRGAQLLAILLLMVTMPVFFVLTTQGYIDMAAAATTITVVGSLLGDSAQSRTVRGRAVLFSTGLCEACLVKVPILTVFAAVVVLAHGALSSLCRVFANSFEEIRRTHEPRKSMPRGVRRLGVVLLCRVGRVLDVIGKKLAGDEEQPRYEVNASENRVPKPSRAVTAACMGLVVFGSWTYLSNWVQHGNPMYPIRVSFAGIEVFPGPLDGKLFGGAAVSSFGTMTQLGFMKSLYASYYDWFAPLSPDSFGSYGPAVGIFCIALFLLRVVDSRRAAFASWGALAALGLTPVLLASTRVPRYGLALAVFMIICAAGTLVRGGVRYRGRLWLLLMASLLSASLAYGAYLGYFKWVTASFPDYRPTDLRRRTGFLPERITQGVQEYYLSAEAVRYIREHSAAGHKLVWNVSCFQALLWNRDYTNMTHFLPGSAMDRYPNGSHLLADVAPEDLKRWIAAVQSWDPDEIVVYKASAYARAVFSMGGRYRVGYEDPESRGRGAVVIFVRDHGKG